MFPYQKSNIQSNGCTGRALFENASDEYASTFLERLMLRNTEKLHILTHTHTHTVTEDSQYMLQGLLHYTSPPLTTRV